MKKKTRRPRPAPQGKDLKKDGTEGPILSEVDKAKEWDKGPTKIFKDLNITDKIW